MPALSEDVLDNWRNPASDSEEKRIENALAMIKNAIIVNETLKTKDIEFVPQGSYCNNTNVRLNSDVDICAMLKDTVYCLYRDGAKREDYGFTDGTITYVDYKKFIIDSLQAKFGKENIKPGNKAIYIESNTYHTHADVVAAFQFRDYRHDTNNNPYNYIEGIKFFSADSAEIISFPKLHTKNGILKNDNTYRKFKRVVRLYKRIKNKMIEDKIPVSENIRSFLLEALLWNVPNATFINSTTWNEILRDSIIYLYNNTKTEDTCRSWTEISEKFYLFHLGRKWTRVEVNEFLVQLWNYLGYK